MAKKKRFWLLNIIIVVAIIGCTAAFVLHYKNWIRIKEGDFKIYSGIYAKTIPLQDIKSLSWVDRIPSMERSHGFSAWKREKGIFLDSLNPEKNVYVFIDDLSQKKIKLVYKDSLELYINLTDSMETIQLFNSLSVGKVEGSGQFLD